MSEIHRLRVSVAHKESVIIAYVNELDKLRAEVLKSKDALIKISKSDICSKTEAKRALKEIWGIDG